MPKNFVAESLVFHWFRLSKNVKVKKLGAGGSQFSAKTVLSHSTESFLRETLLCLRKVRNPQNFMPKRGISRLSVESLLSHSAEKLCRGTLLCSTKLLLSKFFTEKGAGGGREGVSQSSVIFLSYSGKIYRRGSPWCVTSFGC